MDTILVSTDGSPGAEGAVQHAVMLAKRMEASVHGVFAVHLLPSADYDLGVDLESVQSAREAEGESALSTVEQHCDDAGIAFEGHLRRGPPAREIQTLASDIDADVIVMGTHGGSGLSRMLLGSTTIEVLRRNSLPVLAIPEKSPMPTDAYGEILVGTDASPDSEAATGLAVEWSGELGASLHGLYVVEESFTHSAEVEATLEEVGKAALAELEEVATEAGVETSTAIETGAPHAAINSYAKDHYIDLIVVGAHGRGGLERAFLGSVSERLVRSADRPVLVV